MRRDDPYHDWFLDEPLLWFALWLLCIAAWIALSVLLPPSLPDTIIACSPTLVSALFSALWIRPALEWAQGRRWRKTVKQITDAALPGPLTFDPYRTGTASDVGNFPWSVGPDYEVTAERIKAAVEHLRQQKAYDWNGGPQDAAGEGETTPDS